MNHTPHFQVVARGIVFKDNSVLLVHPTGKNHWGVPGGRVEQGENVMQALQREFKEELGQKIEIVRPLFTMDHSFTKNGVQVQELNIYFECSLTEDSIASQESELEFSWIPVASIQETTILPAMLKEILARLPLHESVPPYVHTYE